MAKQTFKQIMEELQYPLYLEKNIAPEHMLFVHMQTVNKVTIIEIWPKTKNNDQPLYKIITLINNNSISEFWEQNYKNYITYYSSSTQKRFNLALENFKKYISGYAAT